MTSQRWEGVPIYKIYLLRLLYVLMFVFLGKDAWTFIFTHKGAWDPAEAMNFSIWASYSLLSFFGIFQPLRMLAIVMLEILYKSIWLIIVALPLWQAGHLMDSPASGMFMVFALVPLPVIAMPWKYFFRKYILVFKKD
ncbi:hypothetical protein [Chitinophaga sancti]|uniref:DoxX-like family protein n=1 Tax=Chitinophaga sancti TaxID=1004 RepID=A0A1K1S186_9BACT|nr:hypothetical protein [Chitinophaga sancti]WQD59769.1 hypothetical protein U0033_17920 [Chitinophaga sancti]WQG88100.1 hypothetical protein SR876_24545 [Chitinophaga sancti]SFW77852.1 hypothetical protein SAMN05661012_04530 [Chitinophaga sancti]